MITPEQLTKLREGRCTPEELAEWKAYFQETDLSDLSNVLAQDWQNLTTGTTQESVNAQKAVWQRLTQAIEMDNAPIHTLPVRAVRPAWQLAVAASVVGLLLAGTGWFIWQQKLEMVAGFENRPAMDNWVVTTNQTTEPKALTLSDGSIISLLPRSQMRYPARFAGEMRSVQLAGEAFFAVRTDKAHPFVVQTKSVLVRVLGTSFTVRDFADQPTAEVSVKTGRVSVSPADGKTGLVLTPNERATLTVASNRLAKSLVAQPEVVNPKAVANQFVFADTPVSEVFGELERAYGVPIRFDPKVMANCTITARLSEQPLFTKLDMICASIGASYQVGGTTVVVQGAGCE